MPCQAATPCFCGVPTTPSSDGWTRVRQLVAGILAHVDAGKTTLAEALLYQAGAIRALGRVDHGDAHLDDDEMERRRGITIFANQASLDAG